MTRNASTLLADALLSVPSRPVPFRNGGIEGYGWLMPDDRIGYLGVNRAGEACAGALDNRRSSKGRPAAAAVSEALHDRVLRDDPLDRFDLSAILSEPADSPWTGPERDAFEARLSAAVDLDALSAVSAGGRPWDVSEYGWTASGPDRARRLRLAREWPWAVGHMVKAEFLGTVDECNPDDASLVVEALVSANRSLGMPANAEAARLLIHPLAAPAMADLSSERAFGRLAAASAFPPAWLPVVPPESDARKRTVFASELRSFLPLAALARDYALATDQRTVDCLSLEGEGWSAALRRHLDRAGLDWDGDEPETAAYHLTARITDMVNAFLHQVMEPAIILVDPEAEYLVHEMRLVLRGALAGVDWTSRTMTNLHGLTAKAAMKVIARDKSLAGMAELSRDWHNNLGPVAAVAAYAAAGLSWPKAFKDRKAPNGLVLRCLTTPLQLLEEGVAMRNCVATYVGPCLKGSCVVVSVRDGGTPVATAELMRDEEGDVMVVQIAGPGNGEASPEASAAVAHLLAEITSGAIPVSYNVLGDGRWSPLDIPYFPIYGEIFPGIVKAWAPFLPRDLRAAGAQAFVDASGYDMTVHSVRLEREYGPKRRWDDGRAEAA